MPTPTALIVEVSITPGATGVVPLFYSPTLCQQSVITPLATNTGTITIGALATPINQAPLTLPFIPGGKPYDLSKLNI
jgi:hypothetical protein